MQKLISANCILRQIEFAAEAKQQHEIERKVKALRHASEDFLCWYEKMVGTPTKPVNLKLKKEFEHYGVTYLERLEEARNRFFALDVLGDMQRVGKVQIVIDVYEDLTWMYATIHPFIRGSDVKAFGDFNTMYSLNPEAEVVTVGALADIEAVTTSSTSRIYEVECRSKETKSENNLFLISKRDIVSIKRYR